MIRGLIEKDLRQNGMAFFFIFLLLLIGLLLLLINVSFQVAWGSSFQAVSLVHGVLIPLSSLVLSHVLVTTEFRHKTQLFLEGLPLPKWRMLAIKYGLGIVLLWFGIGIMLFIARWRGSHSEAMTMRFAAILTLKSVTWVWFVYSLFFAHAFLGRYRVAIGISALLVFMFFIERFPDIANFGPFALVDNRFGFERYIVPWRSLGETVALAILFTGLGFYFGLVRDSTVASLLAERMSPREKVVITFICMAAIFMAFSFQERKGRLVPVQMPGAVEVKRGNIQVSASAAVDSPLPPEEEALVHISGRVADELVSLAEYLHGSSLPPVFIVHRRDFAAGTFEKGELLPEQGLMVRANLTANGFSENAMLQWIVRETVVAKSLGRLELENNAWVLDGFTLWWPDRKFTNEPLVHCEDNFHAARKALPKGFSERDLDQWLTVRQQAGDKGARALAWSGLHTLATQHGEETCQKFLISVLARDIRRDARAWLYEMWHPIPERFQKATGVSFNTFFSEWRRTLETARARMPDDSKR